MGLQSGRASLPASRHVGRKLAAQQDLAVASSVAPRPEGHSPSHHPPEPSAALRPQR